MPLSLERLSPLSRPFRLTLLCGALASGAVLGGCKDDSPSRACDVSAPNCSDGFVCLALDGASGADATCTAVCDPSVADVCGDGLACDPVQGGGNACFEPVTLRGEVTDAASGEAIQGARVLAADNAGSVVTQVAETDASGQYELVVPVVRDAMGVPVAGTFTLRVAAQDYLPFPSGFRPALPIDASAAALIVDEGYVAQNASTNATLIEVPAPELGRPSIAGHVGGDSPAGTLVVAECDAPPCPYGFADADGEYVIFGVGAGDYTVRGYHVGASLDDAEVTVATESLSSVDLGESSEALATVSGQLQIVNGGGASATSVVLIPASTFEQLTPTFVRGQVAPGLRAPEPGTAPNISGAYSIAGVPSGRYAVLAAFENDLLVRDPDPGISGTQIVFVDVAGSDITVSSSFKVTGALELFSPGANGPTEVALGTPPTFEWDDDSGEESFVVQVFDAFGTMVWTTTVPKFTGSGNPSVMYGGPLEAGMYYQWRAESRNGADDPISVTEDLMGVFFVAAAP